MRTALFALPAVALGLVAVGLQPFDLIGFALLIGWGVFELVMVRRRWRRRVDRSAGEVANGIVSRDLEGALKLVLDALPKTGIRWVRVGRSSPTTLRTKTVAAGAANGDEVEVVLRTITSATTELKCVRWAAKGSSAISPNRGDGIIKVLWRELDLQVP